MFTEMFSFYYFYSYLIGKEPEARLKECFSGKPMSLLVITVLFSKKFF